MISLESILSCIISSPTLHAKWLNTLSFLENCGARKIAACEHPTLVKEEMLKHAAEEFRHAYYLKRQISRIWDLPVDHYSPGLLLGGFQTLHYLAALDLHTSRYLKARNESQSWIREVSYLLVTYAIETRAEILYPIYETLLRKMDSKVTVKSILLEEQGHLNDMKKGLLHLPSAEQLTREVCHLEQVLYEKWLISIQKDLET